jgi:nitroimidazol reductase NimA-like FMN-containing flavoprotein (pyridoxamine 5'-phosphate oxidase superfamily)
MTKNNPPQPYNKIRKQKRAKDDDWIRAFLHRAEFGVMATAWGEQPFLVTRNYAYDEQKHCIYMHGAMKGRTFENVSANPRVCFSASEMGRLLPAEKAIEVGVEYAGVVVFGRAVLVEDIIEAKHGLQMLMDKYFPHLRPERDYAPIVDEDLKVTAVFRIEIESWSGKEEKEAGDVPGAFFYKDMIT